MKLLRALGFALATVVALLGCDSKKTAAPAAPLKGSCNNAPKGFCNEFTGSQYTPDQVKAACTMQQVAFSAAACPTAGLVGSCLVQAGAPLESSYRYYGNFPGGRGAAEAQCKNLLRGAWTP